MVRVAVVQLELPPRGPGQSLRDADSAQEAVVSAAKQGVELVVLPELWRTGPFELDTTVDAAMPLDDAEVSRWGELARRRGVWLCAGSILERDPGGPALYNTTLLFNSDGELVTTYRKRHLFGFDSGEAAVLDAGSSIVVVDTPLGATGLATCYDLRFPEHFRQLVDNGAQSVLLPTGWPLARLSHWQVLTRARAIENQVWLVGCNSVGRSGTVELAGHSVVVDPWGNAVEAEGAATTLIVDVDPALPELTRREFPVLRDRLG